MPAVTVQNWVTRSTCNGRWTIFCIQ